MLRKLLTPIVTKSGGAIYNNYIIPLFSCQYMKDIRHSAVFTFTRAYAYLGHIGSLFDGHQLVELLVAVDARSADFRVLPIVLQWLRDLLDTWV